MTKTVSIVKPGGFEIAKTKVSVSYGRLFVIFEMPGGKKVSKFVGFGHHVHGVENSIKDVKITYS